MFLASGLRLCPDEGRSPRPPIAARTPTWALAFAQHGGLPVVARAAEAIRRHLRGALNATLSRVTDAGALIIAASKLGRSHQMRFGAYALYGKRPGDDERLAVAD